MKKQWMFMLIMLFLYICLPQAEEVRADSIFQAVDDTFQSVDGGEISTVADSTKDVTILIFGKTNCRNSASELNSIATSDWIQNQKVRVIFVEIGHATKEQTKAFADQYASKEITVCFDTGSGNEQALNTYLRLAGISMLSLPFTVLIDKNNDVQSTYTGYQSAITLYMAMNQFAIIEKADGTVETERNIIISGQRNYDAANQALEFVNQVRAEEGAPALQMDAGLMETAMLRAEEISLFNSDIRPNGQTCFSLFRESSMREENRTIGWDSPDGAVSGWRSSLTSYLNMINRNYISVGIGCFVDDSGNYYWVQCLDNAPSNVPVKSGTERISHNISILQSLLQFPAEEVRQLGCGSGFTKLSMEIRICDVESGKPKAKLSALNFSFTSSNHEIAEVDVNGIITVKKAGTAIVTAVYKENPSMQVKWTVNKKEHSYRAIYWHDYTEYTCKSCYDSYREYNIAMTEQNVRLAATKVIYNGREQEPAVIVTDDTGNIVDSDNYSLTYTSNKNVGWGKYLSIFREGIWEM